MPPSFFSIRTMGEAQSLMDDLITPSSNMASHSFFTHSLWAYGSQYGACRTGIDDPVGMLCSVNTVHPGLP